MKKSYINPSIVVVRLSMTQPLATSTQTRNVEVGTTNTNPGDYETKGTSDVSVWDDEW